MATTFPTPSSTGIVNPTYGGQFSTAGTGFNQTLLQTLQAQRYSADPVFRKIFYEKIYKAFGFGDWLEENMGWKSFCYTKYSLAHFYPTKNWIDLANTSTAVAGTLNATATLPWAAPNVYVNSNYILPAVGSWLVVPPLGQMVKVTNVVDNGTTFTVTIANSYTLPAFTIPANATVVVLSGQEIADCACPDGVLILEDGPVKEDYQMMDLMTPSEVICGHALDECQNLLFEWTYTDAEGCVQTAQRWYDAFYQKMLNEHRKTKTWQILNNPTWGIIPKLRKYAIRWNWASTSELTLADLQEFANFITSNSIICDTYSFWLGFDAYAAAQNLMDTLGQGRITYGCYDPTDSCKTLNLQFCTIQYMGITFVFHLERGYSDKNALGGNGFNFRSKGIGVPMCNRNEGCGENDEKMFTTVYFQSDRTGIIRNDIIDSDGILNGPGGRNTYGAGCKNHKYTVESEFVGEVHNPEMWVVVNEV